MRKQSAKMRKASAKAQGTYINHKKLKKVNIDTASDEKLLQQQNQLAQNLADSGDHTGAAVVTSLIKKASQSRGPKGDNSRVLEQIAKTNAIIVSKLNKIPKEKYDQDTDIKSDPNADLLARLEALENNQPEPETKTNKTEKPKTFLQMLLAGGAALLTFAKALFTGTVIKTILKPILMKMVKGAVKVALAGLKIGGKVLSTLAIAVAKQIAKGGVALGRMIVTRLLPMLAGTALGPILAIIAGSVGIHWLLTKAAKNAGFNSMESAFGHYTRSGLIALGMDEKLVKDFKTKGFAQAVSDKYFGPNAKKSENVAKAKYYLERNKDFERNTSEFEHSLESNGIIEFSNFPKVAGFMSFVRMPGALKELDVRTLKYLLKNYNWVSGDEGKINTAIKYSLERAKYTDKEWNEKKSQEKKQKISEAKTEKRNQTINRILLKDEEYTTEKEKLADIREQMAIYQKNKDTKNPAYQLLSKTYVATVQKIARRKKEFSKLQSTKDILEAEEKSPSSLSAKRVVKSVSASVESGDSKSYSNDMKLSDVFNIAGNVDVKKLNGAFRNNLYGFGEEYQQMHGKKMGIISGFRSKEHQQRLWDKKYAEIQKANPKATTSELKEMTRKWVAIPGRSMHNHGVAIDFDRTQAGTVSKPLLEKYGLLRRMSYENWHVEPKGINATALADKGEMNTAPKSKTFKQRLTSFANFFRGGFTEAEEDVNKIKRKPKKVLSKEERITQLKDNIRDEETRISNDKLDGNEVLEETQRIKESSLDDMKSRLTKMEKKDATTSKDKSMKVAINNSKSLDISTRGSQVGNTDVNNSQNTPAVVINKQTHVSADDGANLGNAFSTSPSVKQS